MLNFIQNKVKCKEKEGKGEKAVIMTFKNLEVIFMDAVTGKPS